LAALLFSSQLALAQFTQQGPKMVGSGAVSGDDQGMSVALSADGNTAIVGFSCRTRLPMADAATACADRRGGSLGRARDCGSATMIDADDLCSVTIP
jgi:hypothetical protein